MKLFRTATVGLAILVSASAQTIVFNLDALAAKAKNRGIGGATANLHGKRSGV